MMGYPEDRILDYIINTKFEDLSEKTVAAVKGLVLDSIGVATAAWQIESVQSVFDEVKQWGGKPEVSLLVDGTRIPAPMAAFANGFMSHSRDFDDDYEPVGIHCSASVVPAALAAAQLRGNCSGKELLTGVALAVDIMCRLGDSLTPAYGWHQTAIYGAFGSTVAAGRILGLSREELQNAFGIMHCSIPGGNKQGRKEGALTKRLQPAYAAQCAVTAACLAKKGITGCKEFIAGDFGFWSLYCKDGLPTGDARKEAEEILLADLGVKNRMEELSLKPYPCCRFAHPAIDGALQLHREFGIDPATIEEVSVVVSPACFERVGAPFKIRNNPQVDAQFSVAYTVALALTKGQVGMADFEAPTILARQNILDLAKKVHVSAEPSYDGKVPNLVTIKAGGKTYEKLVTFVKGSPADPLNPEELKIKFLDCVSYSGVRDAEWGEQLRQQIMAAEDCNSIEEWLCFQPLK